MSNFVQQLPALIGVIIGALGSLVVTTATQRAGFQQQLKERWNERRLNAYAEYAQRQKATISLSMRIASHLGTDPFPHPLTPKDAAPAITDAVAARESAWEAVLLLGEPDVIETGRQWNQAVWDMEQFLRQSPIEPERWKQLWARSEQLRHDFYAVARHDLGVPHPKTA